MEYIEGVYYSVDFTKEEKKDKLGKYIWICNSKNKSNYLYRVIDRNTSNSVNLNDESCFNKNDNHAWSYSKLATPEEIHWLDLCILNDKYISYEEALKSFKIIKPNKSDSSLEPIYKKLLNIT
jgi:hypothetical protein